MIIKNEVIFIMINIIKNLDKNKLLIIPIDDSNDRKLVHQYLESNNIFNKSSLTCFAFGTNPKTRYLKKCFECNKRNLRFDQYEYDWYVICPKCHEVCYYHGPSIHNYSKYYNNCIVIGINYSRPKHAKINFNVHSDDIINKYPYHIIDKPNNMHIKKQDLVKYIEYCFSI